MKATILTIVVALLILSGCAKSIEEVKNDEYIGKEVIVRGMAKAPTQVGPIKGYILVDKNENVIMVDADDLPEEDEIVRVKATVRELPLKAGYYLED